MLRLKLSVILDDTYVVRANRTYVHVCTLCVRVLKIFYVFLDPPTSVLIKYLVIRRKVRPLVYSSHNVGRHISLTYSPVFPSFLFVVR